jgi:hypothetical protein
MTDTEQKLFGFSEARRYIGCKKWQLEKYWYMSPQFDKRGIQIGCNLKYDSIAVDEMKTLIDGKNKINSKAWKC